MRVLAIDPGPEESAYVIWDGDAIDNAGKCLNLELLYRILDNRDDCEVVIEMIASYGMPVGRETFETCVWIGRFIERAEGGERLTRGEVKMHLCHSMRAKDANVRQALIDRFGPPGTRKKPGLTYGLAGDMWAAFALAVTWVDKQENMRHA